MKSVTIRDKEGKIVVKVIHRKSGVYDTVRSKSFMAAGATIDIRDDKGRKVTLSR